MMDKTLMGSSEANARLERMVRQVNTGKVEYPSGTNMRGSGGREHHAEGDSVGNSLVKEMKTGGVSSAPGRGGSEMKPNFRGPEKGVQSAPRRMAVKQQRNQV